MNAPIFSVIIPAFRAAGTIALAVRSVLAQSEGRFELIIVDDGCPEWSGAIAMAEAAGDPRVRLLNQGNAGVSSARNAGIAAARGQFLAFLDADDAWHRHALATHAEAFALKPDLGVSFGRVRFLDTTMSRRGPLSGFSGPVKLAEMLGENPLCTASNMVMRRSVVETAGLFDATLRHAEDQEYIARILAITAWRVEGLPVELVYYRASPDGLSADLARMESGWEAMLGAVSRLAPATVAGARPQAEAVFQRYLARRALRTGQPGALAYMGRALRASPWTLLTRGPARSLLTLAAAILASPHPQQPLMGR